MARIVRTAWLVIRRTASEYGEDNCSHLAAAISYYALFSIVPLAVFTLSIFGFVVRDEERKEDVTRELVAWLNVEPGDASISLEPAFSASLGHDRLTMVEAALQNASPADLNAAATRLEAGETAGFGGVTLTAEHVDVRRDNLITDTISGVANASGALTIVGVIGILWSASAMFGAVRKSLNVAWDTDAHRPIAQQKAIDLLMVFGLGVLLGLSVAGTAAVRTARALSDDKLGPLSTGSGFVWSVFPLMLPALLTFLAFMAVYRAVPNVQHRIGDVWPGALIATILFELLKNGFALYVANFNNYDVAYGSLGAVLLFMLWTYLTANVLLIGAEVAAEYPRARRAGAEPAESPVPGPPIAQRVWLGLRGLVLRDRNAGD